MTGSMHQGGVEHVWFRLGGALFEVVAIPAGAAGIEGSPMRARFLGLKDGMAVATGSAKADVVAMLLQPSAQYRRQAQDTSPNPMAGAAC
ncbi:MAG: hypothetical protein KF910_09165 [Brevundimonas sp.]|uniref:hypothetical protein n=1 Tax=Brevundimonas sp. TaxID=1871086 RepID=UPI0025BD8925|nr:hypothetical protein [Brevundimonas sp.]MBX3477766.1 hypothetical protein [Brevundimonas sp.]